MEQLKNDFKDMVSSDFERNPGINKAYTWPVIVTLLVLFFPVGFYLLYKRFTYDKTTTKKNVKGLRNTGIILIGIALFYTIMGITGNLDTSKGGSVIAGIICFLAVFGGTGLIFLIGSIKMNNYGKKYEKYISVIENGDQFELDNIASCAGVIYQTLLTDLQEMLDLGYFPGAYIDKGNRELVFRQEGNMENGIPNASKITVIVCKSCGANNKVTIGKFNECQYCGSPLE